LLTGAGVGVQAQAASPSATAASGPRLKANLSSGRHAISRCIYGMNFAGAKIERHLRLPVVRWGGNATTRASDPYNPNCGNGIRSHGSFVKKKFAGGYFPADRRELCRRLGQLPGP
jgi:hypothetical protein